MNIMIPYFSGPKMFGMNGKKKLRRSSGLIYAKKKEKIGFNISIPKFSILNSWPEKKLFTIFDILWLSITC